jgi:COMPASS component SPP1
LSVPRHVNPDPDPVSHRGIQQLERELLFDGEDSDRGLIHNDIQSSNIIVDKDRIVAAVDWEMAGYFGWIRAAEIHVQIRSPNRETYANLNLDPKFLDDILFWSDLYETDYD